MKSYTHTNTIPVSLDKLENGIWLNRPLPLVELIYFLAHCRPYQAQLSLTRPVPLPYNTSQQRAQHGAKNRADAESHVKFLSQSPYKKGLKRGLFLSGCATYHTHFLNSKKEGSNNIGRNRFLSWSGLWPHCNGKRCVSCSKNCFTNLFCVKICSLETI